MAPRMESINQVGSVRKSRCSRWQVRKSIRHVETETRMDRNSSAKSGRPVDGVNSGSNRPELRRGQEHAVASQAARSVSADRGWTVGIPFRMTIASFTGVRGTWNSLWRLLDFWSNEHSSPVSPTT
jgi:hypothetical protein